MTLIFVRISNFFIYYLFHVYLLVVYFSTLMIYFGNRYFNSSSKCHIKTEKKLQSSVMFSQYLYSVTVLLGRIRRTGELLTYIRTLKMHGWELLFSSWLMETRSLEVMHLTVRLYFYSWHTQEQSID